MSITRIKQLFLAALELSPEQRGPYLDRECGEEPDIHRRVRALLAAHDQPDSVLDHLAPESDEPSAADLADSPATELPSEQRPPATIDTGGFRAGETIDAYTLIEPIGEGGMGVVWRAKQSHPVKREVAVKLIKAGMDSAQVLARFEAERQALALMDHPHIAKVLDAGQTRNQRPYFVMELVRGVPLTEYCDAHFLDPRKRLELFIQVCQGIQHAHQKGIIHRDVKPRNVLVTEYDSRPVVKVIDFGVAKATGGSLNEQTVYTSFGAVVGTLEYMSPEQATFQAADVDTRSDIYSLGVLLYELLTGSRPLSSDGLKKKALSDLLQSIREDEPLKPSLCLSSSRELPSVAAVRSVEPRRLSTLVRGDLDWIVMKSLEKDRTRRYETASALADDVLRFLRDEPVSAGPPTLSYRARKFVRRNRAAVVAAALIATALVLGCLGTSAGMLWALRERERADAETVTAEQERVQAQRDRDEAERQRERANENFRRAREAVDHYLTSIAESQQLSGQLLPLRQELLENARTFYDELLQQRSDDVELRNEAVHSRLRLAQIQEMIGSQENALRLYQAVRDELQQAGSDAAEQRQLLAQCWHDIGVIHMKRDEYQQAETALREALAIRLALEQAAESDSPSDSASAMLAGTYNDLGMVLAHGYKPAEAIPFLEQSLELWQQLAEADPQDAGLQSSMGATLNTLANASMMLARWAKSEQLLEQAIEHQQAAVRQDPENTKYLMFLGNHYHNLGQLSQRNQNTAQALEAFQNAQRSFERLVRTSPSLVEPQFNLARVYLASGRLETNETESLRLLEQARAVLEQLVSVTPDLQTANSHLAETLHFLAQAYQSRGRSDDAAAAWRQAQQLLSRLAEADPLNEASHRGNEARCLLHLGYFQEQAGDRDEAISSLEAARDLFGRLVAQHADNFDWQANLAQCHTSLGLIFLDREQFQQCEQELRAAHVLYQALSRQPGETNYRVWLGGARCNLGNLWSDRDATQARHWYEQAVATLEEVLEAHPSHGTAQEFYHNAIVGLVAVLQAAEQFEGAATICRRGLSYLPRERQTSLRIQHAWLLALDGDHAAAVKEGDAIRDEGGLAPQDVLDLAVVFAASVQALRDDHEMPADAPQRRSLEDAYGSRAVALLRRSVESRFVDPAELQESEQFAPLADRDDFQTLLGSTD